MSSPVDGPAFEHLHDDVLYEGHVITLCRSEFRAPDGSVFDRDVVRHPGAVAVVAVRDDETVVLVRQYRAALDAWLIEIPAGKRDVADEPPEITARRELIEEVGMSPGSLELLVRYHNSVGFSDEQTLVYLGLDLADATAEPVGVEEEHMEIIEVPLAETTAMIAAGEITDAKTVIGLTMARSRLGM